MDLAKQLVRSCARAFYSQPPYDVRHVLIVDALVIHGALVFPPQTGELGRHADVLGSACATTIWGTS